MPSVNHHGRTTHYTHTPRTGPRLLCIHGSGGTNTVWKAQRSRLSADVAALDLAGHGASDPVNDAPGDGLLETYVDDVVAVAEATDRTVLVGHSLGGAVVVRTLLDRGLDITAAIVVGAGLRLPVADQLLEWLATDFERFIEFLHQPDRLYHHPDDRLRHQSRQLLASVGQAVTRQDFELCRRYDVRDRIETLDTPLLGLVGDHDTLTPPQLVRDLVDAVDDGTLHSIDDAAHMAMVERPTPVNAAIETFLDIDS